jgi:hypothetical protein
MDYFIYKDSKIEYTDEADEEFSDLNREIKGICTDIVVNDFFKTKNSLFNFLKLIYDDYTSGINKYISEKKLSRNDIIFTFKGGNILRLIAEEFDNELPDLASSKISNFYQKYFKRSDADFSIYINPNIVNYDSIYEDICLLAYNIQLNIREVINNNRTAYLDFYKYNIKYKHELLQQYLPDLNNSNSVNDETNDIYYNAKFIDISMHNDQLENKKDFYIVRNNNNNVEEYDLLYNVKEDNSMVISVNKALEFQSGDGGTTKFALVRTKIYFFLTMAQNNKIKIINRGGELIDVSIPHRKDKSTDIDFSFKEYTLNFDNKSFSFLSYSMDLLIEDLEKILFHVAEYPWDDNKYFKRLNRLCYLYYLEMFLNNYTTIKKNNILNKTKNNIKKCVNNIHKKKLNTLHSFDRLIWYWEKLCLQINDDNTNLTKELHQFRDNINKNLDILLLGIVQINLFCSKGPMDIANNLYNSSVKNIL